jgi:hypothetical protein
MTDPMDRLVDLTIQTRLLSMSSCEWGITDEPFFVADLGQVIRQHRRWRLNLPNVHPFYGAYGTSNIKSASMSFDTRANTDDCFPSGEMQPGPNAAPTAR